jgi:predicted component of viral defense system (DUF524 family)
MEALREYLLPCRSANDTVLARVRIVPEKAADSPATAPLTEFDAASAIEHGETTVQLREQAAYEYEVRTEEDGADLRLRCSLAYRSPSLGDTPPDRGRIVTGNFSGTLLLEIVEGESLPSKPPVASAWLDVRSVKLDYRTEYRGMVRAVANELAGLVADARSSAKLSFRSSWQERRDAGWLQIQIELLREMLDSADFGAAIQRILAFPHERLAEEPEVLPANFPFRWTPAVTRQIASGQPRSPVPVSHALRQTHGLTTLPERVRVQQKTRDRDTPENRFIKHALLDFHAFLAHCQTVFEENKGWETAGALARRLSATLEDWLGRALFREVGPMRFAPLGSPVLQRKAGYREVLAGWLRFRMAAEISWEGGAELFRAGQRNVADLYEYWLFFQLLEWFCATTGQARPAVEELVDGLEDGAPCLRLRKQKHLGPFCGHFGNTKRALKARFDYNREFSVTSDREQEGSWTRKMHPDYTLTFWPDEMTEPEAVRQELLVHVHFDAKYRVEDVNRLFGTENEGGDEEDNTSTSNYKRQDLLKMHAYRDAVRRSVGAYVLYPGNGGMKFPTFHEILPGLGAFAVRPDTNGNAEGLSALDGFLNEVLDHLANRTTARERVTYHIAEAYAVKESPVPYGGIELPEKDIYGGDSRAVPPAEHMVLVAWYRNAAQLQWTIQERIAIVRLGRRPGAWHIQPEFAQARHILLHSGKGVSAPGLWRLRSPGYRVFTDAELKNTGYPGLAAGEIYALCEVEADVEWQSVNWDPKNLIRAIRDFESTIKHRLVKNVGRKSAYPRILPLRELLKARA